MYLYKISNLLFFLFFSNELFRYTYPEQHNKIIFFIIYNYIYYSSKIEIEFLKIQTNYPKIKKCITYFKNINKNDVEFIFNGKVIYETTRNQINEKLDQLPLFFDFIIYSDYTNTIVNKSVLNVLPNNIINYNYEKTDFKFILLEFEIDDKKLKLDLQTETYNFFICGNTINLKFLHYFLNTYYKFENINFENENNIKINLIDNDMNSLSFDNNIKIKLNKTNYDK